MHVPRPLVVAASLLASASLALAQTPMELGFQGRLTDDNGAPFSTPVTVTLHLYDALTDGNLLHSEAELTTFDDNGVFVTTLGDGPALNLSYFDKPLWVEVEVEGAVSPLSPRLPMRAAPWALRSHVAETLETTGPVSLSDQRITDLAIPSALGDAVNKFYLLQRTGNLIGLPGGSTDLTEAVVANASAITTVTTDVGTNASHITTQGAVLAQNTFDVAANEVDITNLENRSLDLEADVGTLSQLDTTDKSNLVAAINELEGRVSSKIVLVKATGTHAENGTALLASVAGLTGTTAGDPYLVVLEPGTYQMTTPLSLPSHVHLLGSGPNVTTLLGQGSSTTSQAAVIVSTSSSLRELSVENAGGGMYSDGVRLEGKAALRRVHVRAYGGSIRALGIDLPANSSESTLFQVEVETTGSGASLYGVQADGPTLLDLRELRVQAVGTGTTPAFGVRCLGVTTSVLRDVQVQVNTETGSATAVSLTATTTATALVDIRARTHCTGCSQADGLYLEAAGVAVDESSFVSTSAHTSGSVRALHINSASAQADMVASRFEAYGFAGASSTAYYNQVGSSRLRSCHFKASSPGGGTAVNSGGNAASVIYIQGSVVEAQQAVTMGFSEYLGLATSQFIGLVSGYPYCFQNFKENFDPLVCS